MNDKSVRVRRGGSWYDDPRSARAANLNCGNPGYRGNGSLGVRLVEVVDDPAPAPYAAKPDRVFRGGSWRRGPQYARVARRGDDVPGIRDVNLGIRLVEVIDE